MSKFIAERIEKARTISLEEGRAKYSAYFINTNLYIRYKSDVDIKLLEDGFDDTIIELPTE